MIMKNSSRHKHSIPKANLIEQMRNGAGEQGLKMHRTALYLGGKTTVLSFCRTKWMKQYKSKNLPHQKVQLAYQYKYKRDWATEAPKPHPPAGSLRRRHWATEADSPIPRSTRHGAPHHLCYLVARSDPNSKGKPNLGTRRSGYKLRTYKKGKQGKGLGHLAS